MAKPSSPEFQPGKIPDQDKMELKEDMTLAANPDGTLRVIRKRKDLAQAAEEFREAEKDLRGE